MEEGSGIITTTAITFWIWFPIVLLILILFIYLGVKIYRNQKTEEKKDDYIFEEVKGKLKLEENVFSKKNKKRNFLTQEDRKFLEENLEEFCQRIGKKSYYYIPAFHKKNKFNFGSAVGGVLWLGYRGMYLEVLVLLLLISLLDILTYSFGLTINFGPIVGGILGSIGNYIYFKSLQRRIVNNKNETSRVLGTFIAGSLIILYAIFSSNLEYKMTM